MGVYSSEWLVTDPKGAFSMGTLDGVRTRKYHGFFMGVASRTETSFLADLDFECNGNLLWPHQYAGPEGLVNYPELSKADERKIQFHAKISEVGPEWQWTFRGGKLTFTVEPGNLGGIILSWKWESKVSQGSLLKIRSFWAMRDLHSLGGSFWSWNPTEPHRAVIRSDHSSDVYCQLHGSWKWIEDPQWFHNFHYAEEAKRGYDSNENLYSAGILEIELQDGECGSWVIALDANDLEGHGIPSKRVDLPSSPVFDFLLTRPAGILAGFPWFGEWGRDTFVSLPGIAAVSIHLRQDPERTWTWSQELLHRWGYWIETQGMLPNVLGKDGSPHWDSADATLWWCHALASLWSFSLCPPFPFLSLEQDFSLLLDRAIQSIREGQHLHLKETKEGLLEVTSPHTTWMDARVDNRAVTPRLGRLPEINALWFEARCLQWLWSKTGCSFSELETLGKEVLQCREDDRPNMIFLHSLPLAPSFVLQSGDVLERDLTEIAKNFWTPVGLKTLIHSSPHFKAHCIGTQRERDLAYHQGSPWGWLGGHFEMARHRLVSLNRAELDHSRFDKMFTPEILKETPIRGHIPELFDAEPPFTPRGAPAQAWSLACFEEAKARRRMRVDLKISKVLAQRWLERQDRDVHLRKQKRREEGAFH